ncbi:hypothetical protein CANARDRAFT_30390 [[Candida] arabinofermentans NRRL YB-2248]|uniref:Proteolipid membrane potential modulator n=1 Tax=[Candida] arabinofermentans NRRL YB-2248 TaxID=983967 RepID=A0A1E4SU85_9ASCO|nr:hypothetical protein CANARDRAFT_30390 [[Candida] arabinofermentans NRRL YB-2248]
MAKRLSQIGILRIIICILSPAIGAGLVKGYIGFLLGFLLNLLFYIPGLIYSIKITIDDPLSYQ